jgi:hypothetical protein
MENMNRAQEQILDVLGLQLKSSNLPDKSVYNIDGTVQLYIGDESRFIIWQRIAKYSSKHNLIQSKWSHH